MGNTNSLIDSVDMRLANFEDVLLVIKRKSGSILMTTMIPGTKPLIVGTLEPTDEVDTINRYIANHTDILIVIYGENNTDISPLKKKRQLDGLGFTKVFVYGGGMFEWLLLQDIYGTDSFRTTSAPNDLLTYRGGEGSIRRFEQRRLE